MPSPEYLEVLVDDKARHLRIPMHMETDRPRGFHDDDRMIFWGYSEEGVLDNVQDTEHGKRLWPPKVPDAMLVPRYEHSTVYFIRAETGQIKIGLAKDPNERLRTLQVGCPVALSIEATTEGGIKREREYHRHFTAHRLHGEWFEPHPDILAEIARLTPVCDKEMR